MAIPYATVRTYAPFARVPISAEPLDSASIGASATYSDSNKRWTISPNGEITMRIPVEENGKLRAVQVRVMDTADNLVKVRVVDTDTAAMSISTPGEQDSTGAGYQWVTVDFGHDTEHDIGADNVISVVMSNEPVAAGTDDVYVTKVRFYYDSGVVENGLSS